MTRRTLGNTGAELSIIGLGGIVVARLPQEEANRIVAGAVDRGVNYFDVAPTYGDAQDRLGPALQPYRKDAFLACKTTERTAEGSAKELEGSLRALRTDHVDVYQLHGLITMEEVETAFGPGGAMETFTRAKQQGKARFLGFSAHSVEAALEALRRYPFDSVLFPFNYVCWHKGDFGPQVLEAARQAGAGRLALKAMARTNWADRSKARYDKTWYEPFDELEPASLALRWTLSQDITAAVPPGEPKVFAMALDIAARFQPITPEEEARLKGICEPLTPIFSQR
jgi:aryl-alcohol dehydrogenase-like predicted oxidoreductase